jgi:hypothetical protein
MCGVNAVGCFNLKFTPASAAVPPLYHLGLVCLEYINLRVSRVSTIHDTCSIAERRGCGNACNREHTELFDITQDTIVFAVLLM